MPGQTLPAVGRPRPGQRPGPISLQGSECQIGLLGLAWDSVLFLIIAFKESTPYADQIEMPDKGQECQLVAALGLGLGGGGRVLLKLCSVLPCFRCREV